MTEMFEMLSTNSWISEASRHGHKHQPSSSGGIQLVSCHTFYVADIVFEFVYTPKHGSWLNVAEVEVELNVMIRQCLNRRIDSIDVLRAEVAAWQQSRDRFHAKVDWQFTTDDARIKLKRLYPTLEV